MNVRDLETADLLLLVRDGTHGEPDFNAACEEINRRLPLDRSGEKCAACEHRKSHSTPYRCEECTDCTCKPPRAESTGNVLHIQYGPEPGDTACGADGRVSIGSLDATCEECRAKVNANITESLRRPALAAESSEWTKFAKIAPGDIFQTTSGAVGRITASSWPSVEYLSSTPSADTPVRRLKILAEGEHVFRVDEATVERVAEVLVAPRGDKAYSWDRATARRILEALRGEKK